ncbi:hypothetical protein TEA_012157 [Camellia sinensis var. sinensis]|uniref:Protein kinase domain-containing protein n=1 Tax=Camellia sinensis var. sinensis TaxID=542762 RepID=A0A4S4DPM9_CAMSN|nr:hypothetical protein TEA_012157 [Camellia sinensis var. sinensis]
MVFQSMGVKCNTYGIQLSCFAILILVLDIQGCFSLNSEGLALLEFRKRVDYDPYGAFANWNVNDNDPCMWSGVFCVDGEVQMLELNGLSLNGELASELGNLTHLRSLLLCNNNFDGDLPPELGKLNLLSELQFDENLAFAVTTKIGCINRKFGHCMWQSSLKQLKKADSFMIPIKWTLLRYLNVLPLFKSGKDSLHNPAYNCCDELPEGANDMHVVQNVQNLVNMVRRRLLQQSSNLAAAPASGSFPPDQIIALPSTRSSGSFPAVPNAKKGQSHPPVSSPADLAPQQNHNTSNPNSQISGSINQSPDQNPSSGGTSGNTWKYIVVISGIVVLLIVAAAMFFMCRTQAVSNIGPWKTGLSGQLQKAFVTGVPKLNRAELETACEDFSNIIDTIDGCTVYKGTLSSGVEIAVASTAITAASDWSKRSEVAYRKKIDTLSRINHKNFVNLIGYCEEEEPFTRMMVFEYAPNGTLSEHLHVKEVEHLDWNVRLRIIMGTAYCLQHMHDLNPPVAHFNLNSNAIFLTDDYAAKIGEIGCWAGAAPSKSKISGENESEHSALPPLSDPETNVYGFGVLLLEVISGKLPHSEEQGPLVNWANEYLSNKESFSNMIDPTLKSSKNNELDIICEVIQDCIQQDARKRPTMKEVTSRLKEIIAITPDQAVPRLSPLWWAELEILSAEAS